jgi:hypothetical protein
MAIFSSICDLAFCGRMVVNPIGYGAGRRIAQKMLDLPIAQD